MLCYTRTTTRSTDEQQPRDRGLRASDADRERTAEVLREQAGVGRLEPAELEERLEAALRAKTLADLDALTADLPRAPRREPRPTRDGRLPVSPLVLIVAVLVTVSVLVGHPAFWLFFLLFFAHSRPWKGPRWRQGRASHV